MQRGEVWWVEFDPAVGSEIKKIRPAVIVSNDSSNKHLSRVHVVPLTSNLGKLYPSETVVSLDGKESKVMADQIMTADKQRLKGLLGKLNRDEMKAIEKVIKIQLGISL